MSSSDPIESTLRAIAQRLRLQRPLCFLDLETTGVDPERDRIVEVCVLAVDADGAVTRFVQLVNPGVPIPAAATDVHHITDEDVRDAPAFAQIARQLARDLADCDCAGFNLRSFDLKMLAAEFARAKVAWDPDACRVVDVMVLYHRLERRDLTAAVKFYCDRVHDGHRAEVDVRATIDVLHAQLERYDHLADVDVLHTASGGRQNTWVDPGGKVVWQDGEAALSFGKHRGRTLKTLVANEPGYLRWMLGQDFGDDLRRIVGDALEGRFPAR